MLHVESDDSSASSATLIGNDYCLDHEQLTTTEAVSPDSLKAASEHGLFRVLLEEGGKNNGSTAVSSKLFLGTQTAAQDRSLLEQWGLYRIVCVGTPAFHSRARPASGATDSTQDDRHADDEFCYLEIPLLDLPSENLIERLDSCTSFIEDGMRRGQGVLVNCVFAQSRSAAVVVAYLMKFKSIPYDKAVIKVRDAQPTVHINPGFEAQLMLYRDMGCNTCMLRDSNGLSREGPIPGADATYRWFVFACSSKNAGQDNWPASASADTACGGPAHAPAATSRCSSYTYRCKACRVQLFSDENVIDHTHPIVRVTGDTVYASFSRNVDGNSWLAARDMASAAATQTCGVDIPNQSSVLIGTGRMKGRSRDNTHRGAVIDGSDTHARLSPSVNLPRGCTSTFTEVLKWMNDPGRGSDYSDASDASVRRAVARERSGKITCPGMKRRKGSGVGGTVCGSKLGSWSLDGTACSCGVFVTPSVQFALSRVDRMRTI